METNKQFKNLACSSSIKKDIKRKIFYSCLELFNSGYTKSGKYDVKPFLNTSKTVYCDQDTEGGGWTVFLRNAHGLVTFDKNWTEYKNGFGNVKSNFWLGNEFMYSVTKLCNSHVSKPIELYVMVTGENDQSYYAMYKNFAILSENTSYTLQISHYLNGTMGDALAYHNNTKFSTKDKDNDEGIDYDCAKVNGGYGWWYKYCFWAALTRMAYDKANYRYKPAPWWYRGLKNATMMFREKR